MSYYFPEGTRVYYSSTFGAADTITAISNASPAVASSTAHGNTNGAELLITSGWDDINNIVVRAAGVTTDSFQLEGLDTTDTGMYLPGQGAGTARAITAWQEIPQVMEPSTEGGDAIYTDVRLLARMQADSIPTGFNAVKGGMTIAWDPQLAALRALWTLSRTRRAVALKFAVGGGAFIYGYGFIVLREMPGMSSGRVLEVQASYSLNGRVMGYGAA